MRKVIFSASVILFILTAFAVAFYWWILRWQGLSDEQLNQYKKAKIRRDRSGVMHVTGAEWLQVIEAQGFSAASERLFQMDLMRRKGDGALAEIFGKDALAYDRQQRLEDWRFYAEKAYQTMPSPQRATCDAYARGVNQFIDEFPRQIGLEYLILKTKPPTWSCLDSILIAMVLTDNMTRSWSRDIDMSEWRAALPDPWWNFVFPLRHPWNELIFDDKRLPAHSLQIPEPALPLSHPRDEDFILSTFADSRGLDGSNSWAYRGAKGAWLANDPHLANSVPQLWIPLVMRTDDGWWAAGTAVPGLPGILIGMNADLAWSITNTAEDVDDAVFENPENVIETITREIRVKAAASEFVKIRRTPRGPIVKELSPNKLVTRQWLAQKPGILSLPAEKLNHAKDWDEFNQAIDEFQFVPLSFTMLDRQQNMGLRISGCDIDKVSNGAYAESWEKSSWSTTCDTSKRPRHYIPYDSTVSSAYLATANQRLWDDEKLHNWADDDRIARIRQVLSRSDSLTIDDMRILQLDTTSAFHRAMLLWLLKNGSDSLLDQEQAREWEAWTGDIKDCPSCMSEANDVAMILDQLILRKVTSQFTVGKEPLPAIKREMKRARVVSVIENPQLFLAVGLEPSEVAVKLLHWVSRKSSHKAKPWQERNLWTAQHPFVGRIPMLDRIFAIKEWPQFGAASTIRAERPNHGPSMRLIWTPGDPSNSLWSFPIGTSGHALSNHYQDWLNFWQSGGMSEVPEAL
jgi:penicillin amidase